MNPRKLIGLCFALLCLEALVNSPALCTRIGILNQPDFPKIGAPSQPEHLAQLLSEAGYQPVLLSAEDLADPTKLDPKVMPVVVLPYGPVFPAEALDNWRGYLHNGGGFLSTGGYAFDTPVWRVSGKWLTWEQLSAIDPKHFAGGRRPAACTANSRSGNYNDGMEMLLPDCLTVFDASFPLEYAAKAVSAKNQTIAPADLKLAGPFEGWVADAMVGDGSRQIPIVKACDRWGRPRGAIGSIVYHLQRYYANSPWAIFGVTNKDIFSPGSAETDRVFVATIDRLVRRISF